MQAGADEAVARYRENVAWRRQTVTLFADRFDVHRSISLADEAEWSCSLLAPQFQTGRRRDGLFTVGLSLLGVWFTVVADAKHFAAFTQLLLDKIRDAHREEVEFAPPDSESQPTIH